MYAPGEIHTLPPCMSSTAPVDWTVPSETPASAKPRRDLSFVPDLLIFAFLLTVAACWLVLGFMAVMGFVAGQACYGP